MIEGLDPTSGPVDRASDQTLAPRPTTLDGAVVAVVANGLGEGERFLGYLVEELAASDDVIGVVKVRKSSVSVPPEPSDWERITSEATVAITGFGG